MSELYRRVSQRMWVDADFQALSRPQPNAQSLWQYLLTGLHTRPVPGLWAVTQGELAAKLKWDPEAFRIVLSELLPEQPEDCANGQPRKVWFEADWDAGVIWIPNSFFHNEPQSPKVIRGWKKHVDLIPECALKNRALEELRGYCHAKGEPWGKAFDETFAKPRRKPFPKPMALVGAGSGAGSGTRERENARGRARGASAGDSLSGGPNGPFETEHEAERARAGSTSSRTDTVPSSGSAAGAVPGEAVPGDFDASAMRAVFVQVFQQARPRSGKPHMGGEGTGGLHARVLDTARARGVDPRGLFVATAQRWLAGKLNDRELSAPLACFASAWGAQVERVNGHAADPKTALMRKCGEALQRKDMVTYKRLNEQLAAMGGSNAPGGE